MRIWNQACEFVVSNLDKSKFGTIVNSLVKLCSSMLESLIYGRVPYFYSQSRYVEDLYWM